MRNLKIFKQRIVIIMIVYFITAGIFFFVAGESLFFQRVSTSMIDSKETCGEIHKGDVLQQKIVAETTEINGIQLFGATYGRKNHDILYIRLLDLSNKELSKTQLNTENLVDNSIWQVDFKDKVIVEKGNVYIIEITSDKGCEEDSVTLYYGDSIAAARANVEKQLENDELLLVNGHAFKGQLCTSVIGTKYFLTGPYFWYGAVVIGLLLFSFILYIYNCAKKEKKSSVLEMLDNINKYSFLVSQLVSRDFKTKYKRSVLGILWSFLNPLLTMAVQFIIFSTLFKSSIENYPIYLLSGIVCYNFFNEVANMCLTSITSNESLIKKVYVPKYIYPLSRSLSSGINFLFSLIPLIGVMLITRTPITPAFVLLVFAIFCLYIFSLGIGLILASLMVFFRDMQFLWGVISMIWMYATPIIYPESILPSNILMILKLNPLYHIVRIFRAILIDGVSPEPRAYLFCLILSIVPLIMGILVFKKTEDKFVLHL